MIKLLEIPFLYILKVGWKWKAIFFIYFSLSFLLSGCIKKEEALYIDGKIVSEKEIQILSDDIDQILYMKALQAYAIELNIIDDFFYDNFLKELSIENARRKEAKEKGEVIYGPIEYDENMYYKYLMGEYESQIKEKLAELVTEEDLLQYYEEHKEEYKPIDTYQVSVKMYQDGDLLVEEEITLDAYTYRSISENNEELANTILTLEEGEKVSYFDANAYEWILTCLTREESAYEEFENISGAIESNYISTWLDDILKDKMKNFKVEDRRQKV